jgi:hypothetical protein
MSPIYLRAISAFLGILYFAILASIAGASVLKWAVVGGAGLYLLAVLLTLTFSVVALVRFVKIVIVSFRNARLSVRIDALEP